MGKTESVICAPRRGRLLLYLAAGAFGTLGAFDPINSHWAGVAATAAIIAAAVELTEATIKERLSWSLAAIFLFGIVCFHWQAQALAAYGRLSAPVAIVLFLLLTPLFALRFPLLLALWPWWRARFPEAGIYSLSGLALAGDLALFQIFPWYWGNLTGDASWLLPAASLIGIYGLGLALFTEAFLALWVFQKARGYFFARRSPTPLTRFFDSHRPSQVVVLAGSLILLGVYSFFWRAYISGTVAEAGKTNVALLQPLTTRAALGDQPDIPFAAAAINKVLSMGLRALAAGRNTLDLLVIPESAVPFFRANDAAGVNGNYSAGFDAAIHILARVGNADILYNEIDYRDGARFNAATILGADGQRRGVYYKRRLFPFGEFLPFEDILPVGGLRGLFPEIGRYSPGEIAQILPYQYRTAYPTAKLDLPDEARLAEWQTPDKIRRDWPPRADRRLSGSLAPLICYEVIFPALARDFFGKRAINTPSPDFLVQLVNDGWFGDGIENYQHYGIARYRAVEQGRYLLRAGLTGPSGVIDPLGVSMPDSSDAGREAISFYNVPRLPFVTTPYQYIGEWPVYIFLLVLCLGTLAKKTIFRRAQKAAILTGNIRV